MILTGTSGFVGIHLLETLSREGAKVVCLQRCDSPEARLARLASEARTAGLGIDFSRVDVVSVDLAEPRFGIAEADWTRLAEEGDAILHCGTFVHHLRGYGGLKAANVDSTEALLQLSLTMRRKALCFVSTMSVPMMLEGEQRVEECIDATRPLSDKGYLLGKWMSEQRMAAYSRAHDLPATVVRVGNVMEHSRTGHSNYRHNHFWLFNQGCIQLGAYRHRDDAGRCAGARNLCSRLAFA
ncbi:Non-ribosomal peptide synthase [Candidatus Paraburkholderia calva]|nr:Non-ribosomal peptide synthase [Candidatus Paraburkholderia calva]